ncbi:MAG: sulfite exporter TauE/SafE family protein [Proteobacteria bacterium]|nr:sulfite exporter TauE/SafE family protein [Pseudomonadota bacterium]
MDTVIEFLIGGTSLDLFGFAVLCGVSFLGSFIAGSLGLGGGVLVLATMASFLPPTVLIPVHGTVQMGSNLGRAVLSYRHILTSIVPAFFVGTIIGAAIGAQLVVSLPTAVLQVVLALFVLYATWAPKFKASDPGQKTFFGVGVIGALVTMFVGATGPLVGPFAAAACKERNQFVATHATLMTIQHGLKLVAFGLLGFSYGSYLPLLVGLLALGFAGTYCGKLMLNRLPEKVFRIGLKAVLTVLALRLLYVGAGKLLG